MSRVVVAAVAASLLLALAAGTGATAGASAAGERPHASWLVRAGKNFQRAGEYTVRLSNTRFEDAIKAYGKPSGCRVVGGVNHAIAVWADRGIWSDLWTYGSSFPEGENGCISPDLIYVSEIRLTDTRWTTSLGLHVGDRTTKLRRLYPRAPYSDKTETGLRSEYTLVQARSCCLVYPQLTAQVKNGRVVAFWLPVGGEGE